MSALTDPAQEPLAVREPSVGELMQQAMSSGITENTVAVMERLVTLRREMRADDAKQEFFRAFVKMQRAMKRVVAIREVKNDKGELMYTFAAFEDIRAEGDPILSENGFGFSFDTKDTGDRLVSIFTLIHEGGHSQSNQFAVRYSGPPKTSAAQADTSTKTMAMKGAYCDGCGIVISKYTSGADGRVLGAKITPEQAEELKRRFDATGHNLARFLDYADAQSFEDIDEGSLGRVTRELERYEKVPKKPKPAAAVQEPSNEPPEQRNPDGTFKF